MEENRSMQRKLETSLDDENLRSAVLLRFPCEQCRAGVSAWLGKEVPTSDKDYEVHC